MSPDGQWPMGEAPTPMDYARARRVADKATDCADLLAMLRRVTFNLTSVQLIGGADERRAALCEEARALIKRCEGK